MLRESTKPVDMTGSGLGGGLGGAKAADGLIQVLCPRWKCLAQAGHMPSSCCKGVGRKHHLSAWLA